MRLLHLHSMVKREAFSLAFPLTDSMVGGFIGYSLGIFLENKASTISYDTAQINSYILGNTKPSL